MSQDVSKMSAEQLEQLAATKREEERVANVAKAEAEAKKLDKEIEIQQGIITAAKAEIASIKGRQNQMIREAGGKAASVVAPVSADIKSSVLNIAKKLGNKGAEFSTAAVVEIFAKENEDFSDSYAKQACSRALVGLATEGALTNIKKGTYTLPVNKTADKAPAKS